MTITVYTAKNKLFDNITAKSAYLPSANGDMQILDNHIPVIVALRPGRIIFETTSNEKININVQAGYVQFADNNLVAVIQKMSLSDEELEKLQAQAEAMRNTEIRREQHITEQEFEERIESEKH